jgi:hypothetical protein
MLRSAFLLVLAFALQGVQVAQVESHGVPASVLSPTSPGVAHGVPASVNSPTTPRGSRVIVDPNRFRVRFGSPRPRRNRRDHDFIPVPIFIPAYPLTGDYANGDAEQAAADESAAGDAPGDSSTAGDDQALREAYNRGAHDALAQQRGDSRYGQHYLDSREKSQPAPNKDKAQDDAAAQDPPDSSPAAVFIFKDGHKLETQNYAIQGQTLFDFSNNQLKKIKLADLDLDATKKANDDLGITVKLPPTP